MTFGSDFNGVEDIDFGLTFLQGLSGELLAMAQAVARRFVTPRNGLWYADGYGLDMRSFLADSTPISVAEGLVSAEARKDERIVRASTSVVVGDSGGWTVTIHAFGSQDEEFSLTFLVTPEKVSLI